MTDLRPLNDVYEELDNQWDRYADNPELRISNEESDRWKVLTDKLREFGEEKQAQKFDRILREIVDRSVLDKILQSTKITSLDEGGER